MYTFHEVMEDVLSLWQFTFVERGIKNTERFKGIMTYGGRMNGVDSAVGHTDLSGKVCTLSIRTFVGPN